VGGGQHGLLRGGTGRNLIIAGTAGSRLAGGGDDSILIAGVTAYDINLVALDKIMMEWMQNTSVGSRIHNLRFGGGLNGMYRLFTGFGGTVKSNMQLNELADGGGTDWLFLRTAVDKHFNPQSTDVVTPL
jgi:hypothetical protein